MQEQFLTRAQAGKYLHDKWGFGGASVLAEAHQAGTGPVFVKPGAKVFYTKASIDAWAQAIMLDPFKKAGLPIEPEPTKAKEPAPMNQPTKYGEADCEAEIIAKGKTAPRVKPEDLDALCAASTVRYFRDDVLTICVITLPNGFKVTGESACASPENYDEAIGQKLSFAQARNKLWPLEGYRLRCELAEAAK